jgi:hypothetical protein
VQPSHLSVMLTALVAESPTERHTLVLPVHRRDRVANPGTDRPSRPRAGALATALLTGVSYGTLVSIPITALSETADVLLLESHRRTEPGAHVVPPTARPLLAAARTFQVLRGAEPHHALFRGGLGGTGHFLRSPPRSAS